MLCDNRRITGKIINIPRNYFRGCFIEKGSLEWVLMSGSDEIDSQKRLL